jgi:SAM-dependent methyltransferase
MALTPLHPAVQRLFAAFQRQGKVLDAGAGQGALSLWLAQNGFEVTACELQPELFRVPEIPCLQVDLSRPLPFADAEFDAIACVEVLEHVEDQFSLLREFHRILTPGGRLVLTVPNVLSMAARWMYFWTGFLPLFARPMNEFRKSPEADHIHPIAYPQLRYLLHTNGLHIERVATDRYRRAGLPWLPLWPVVSLATWLRLAGEPDPRQRRSNAQAFRHLISPALMLGRALIVVAIKAPAAPGGPV